jgi:hypothetical protein
VRDARGACPAHLRPIACLHCLRRSNETIA